MVGNVSPNLFITFLGRKSCFGCVWFRLGFQNGFCWFWKWVYEMSRVLHLFMLVIAGYCVKMIGFERLVDSSLEVQVFAVAARPSRRDAHPSRRDPRSGPIFASRSTILAPRSSCIGSIASRYLTIAPRSVCLSRRDTLLSRREYCFCSRVQFLSNVVCLRGLWFLWLGLYTTNILWLIYDSYARLNCRWTWTLLYA